MNRIVTAAIALAAALLLAGCPASGEEVVRGKIPNSPGCAAYRLTPHEIVLEQPGGTRRRSVCVNQETYDYNVLGGKYRVRLNN